MYSILREEEPSFDKALTLLREPLSLPFLLQKDFEEVFGVLDLILCGVIAPDLLDHFREFVDR